MAACRFCGARLEVLELPFRCPLCGRINDPRRAPVHLVWSGNGFAWSPQDQHLPFASRVTVAADQTALVRIDGRNCQLNAGTHPVYPADPEAVRVVFVNLGWRQTGGSATRAWAWPGRTWELRVDYALEARVLDPKGLCLDGNAGPAIDRAIRDAVEAQLDDALKALAPVDREGRDALGARVDAALSGIDDAAVNQSLEKRLPMAARRVTLRRALLAAEYADGEPCPRCGRLNARAEGVNATCGFCAERLFWCPNCRRHVVRRDDRWCPACGGRLYA